MKTLTSVKDEALGHRETVTFCVIIPPTERDRLYLSFSAQQIFLIKVVRHKEKRVRRDSSTEGEFDDELRLCIVVGESRAISDRSLDVHSRKNPHEIYGPYVGGYESHIFHVSPRARRRDCPRDSLTGKAIVASFGAFGHPITTARHSVLLFLYFRIMIPRMDWLELVHPEISFRQSQQLDSRADPPSAILR
ncbi:uncharacterized protein TNIN_252051 [Trichonephila inaurata madagascariensis]|uniref:Uncharacterized protein n=1 Tax=Trichonephila inaurata madagascariensis TaxID=2747483 RepID=A0A8X7BVV1_9ARAC|nr:uncharacterized protein TNIN_252051 [Trichonephila inaurata madagascariensis]